MALPKSGISEQIRLGVEDYPIVKDASEKDHAEGVLVDDGFVQQVIQVLTGNLADLLELQQLVLDVGADLLAVVLPLTGRALEVIGNVVEL